LIFHCFGWMKVRVCGIAMFADIESLEFFLAADAQTDHLFNDPPADYADRRASAKLVANLCRNGVEFVHLAAASLALKTGVGICVSPQCSCRQHPWLDQYLRILNGDAVQDDITLPREFLHDMHVRRVEEPTAPKPCCPLGRDARPSAALAPACRSGTRSFQ